jgi:hypothetical protein
MLKLIAIELENFQSIEARIRIDFKPITMLFGPNSAGKSSIFDAFELLRILLDPTQFDKDRATEMVNRWARRKNIGDSVRSTSLAIEFELDMSNTPYEMWRDNISERGNYSSTRHGLCFWWDEDSFEEYDLKDKNIARIEISLRVEDNNSSTLCHISEFSCSLNKKTFLNLSKQCLDQYSDQYMAGYDEQNDNDDGCRWLTISKENIFFDNEILEHSIRKADPNRLPDTPRDHISSLHVACGLSPFELTPSLWGLRAEGLGQMICQNSADIFFYLGTILFEPMRKKPGIVRSDRRTPTPIEALALVDLDLGGWWSRNSLSPSSPAFLLKTQSSAVDEHFRALAELAHAELLLKAVRADFWGDSHAAKYIEEVRPLAKQLERINTHLEESLFREKLYKLSCASTLMVPIDLNEDDPLGFYAFAQPAAVRLLLQDQSGQKIELQDVGSGIPFVLPVLYAATSQGLAMIQQPELHLHPALQSQIADVFIEESNASDTTQFLVETHSEHLLLRLLRRIRDTEKGKSLSDSLKLTNEDIAIYYFDPQIGNATEVTALPITPLGDFYTDWPRGFFEERNDDLFDKE